MTELSVNKALNSYPIEKTQKASKAEQVQKNDSSESKIKNHEINSKDSKDITSKGKAKDHVSLFGEGEKIKDIKPSINILSKMISPESVVNEIRKSKGNERTDALLGFQEKLDRMGDKGLKNMRDYLVNEMASPKNKDDELLGSLLNKVNNELDQRGKIQSIDLGPIFPPKPVICPPINRPFDEKIKDFEKGKEGTINNKFEKKFVEEMMTIESANDSLKRADH